MRTIGVVTVGRSDYGIYLPVLRQIQNEPELKLHLIVSGMHLSPEFGRTVQVIEEDGFEVGDSVEMLVSSDSPEAIAKSMGLGTIGFAQSYARFRPDILLVLGDRFEMHAAVVAALPFKLPVAHIHGGELTEGAIDDSLRHSITKMSHLHFVSTGEYGDRVLQLGEEGWRITLSGAPSLDNLHSLQLLDTYSLEIKYGLDLETPPLLVTFHPVTLEHERTEWQLLELLAALKTCGMPVIFTQPNADTSGRTVDRLLREFVPQHPWAWLVDNMGTQGYFSLMSHSAAMVGNSSSGIIEAPSFRLPVVNLGTRQDGRIRAANVIDVGYERGEILAGIEETQGTEFQDNLRHVANPYDQGGAAGLIVSRLLDVQLEDSFIRKQFNDISAHVGTAAVGQD